ncbi:hypothetical protein IAG44_20410 [Streptomyces roseirectus]|uniref:Uncharacterized protein n=1 Tax=Streptomyces roseirectus TaxID=2768066 RepID=A0A7H0IFJ0_9ACTN|nr:hypothetical protein [Streptomyces roseirectus]QNP71556.1 hypothetical protein IAG44_20410 [Streptomyces roseirectus]
MDFLDAYHLWADAHEFYGASVLPGAAESSGPTAAWETRLAEEAPNGALLHSNALFDALSNNTTLHLLHVTHALEEISEHGVLYPSGGCLVGSIYCAPLTPTGEGLRMHNLAGYVLNREAPAFLRRVGRPGATPTPLVFEIDVPHQAYRGLAGIDYLRLGAIHLRIYSLLEYLLSKIERHQLRETITSRTKNSVGFLALASAVAHAQTTVDPELFLGLLDSAIPRLPILGYVYFEALAEYLMLYSTSAETQRLAELGEFNNRLYKDLIFSSELAMAGTFDLAKFRPPPARFDTLLAQVDPTIDPQHARRHLTERVSHLIAARLFTPGQTPEEWRHTRWEFDSLATHLGPLLGHLIHRELRTFGRYPHFYFYFDQHKALQAWNYWNHMDIVTPFNGTIPKGEIGINPAYPDLAYRVWRAEQDDAGRLHPVQQLDLTIAPRLVDIKHTLMRNSRTLAGT